MRPLSLFLAILSLTGSLLADGAARLKELVTVEGVRDNQLIGYGLVVGLAGTGDRQQTVFSVQSLTNMLRQMGVTVPPTAIRVTNTASVMVSATLPPFAQPGMKIDITAAAIGDASNLQGGLLLLTALKGVDGQIYAMAQGPVVTGGFVAGRALANQMVNHPTVGRVPSGAIVEKPSPTVTPTSRVKLQLRQPDFSTASAISSALNKKFATGQPPVARAENSAVVSIAVPAGYASRVADFIAELEQIRVEADRTSRVVINERNGTIVMGRDVRVAPVAILHGNLSIEVRTELNVSQPTPFSQGKTQIVPQQTVAVKEEKARNVVLNYGATVEELVRALNAIGSTPRDVIAILQSLKAAGALEAEIEVI